MVFSGIRSKAEMMTTRDVSGKGGYSLYLCGLRIWCHFECGLRNKASKFCGLRICAVLFTECELGQYLFVLRSTELTSKFLWSCGFEHPS